MGIIAEKKGGVNLGFARCSSRQRYSKVFIGKFFVCDVLEQFFLVE